MSSSFGRGVSSNPRLFLALLSVVAVGGAVMLALQAVVPESGDVRAAVFVTMAVVAACYVGMTE